MKEKNLTNTPSNEFHYTQNVPTDTYKWDVELMSLLRSYSLDQIQDTLLCSCFDDVLTRSTQAKNPDSYFPVFLL